MFMRKLGAFLWAAITLIVSSCGTYVPGIHELPFASERERSDFIQAIVRNVRCEVQDSVFRLYESQREIDPENRNLKWFDDWAAQISLTLTIDEKGSLNPVVNWLPTTPANSIFNLNVGVTASTEAQRVDKIGSFFEVKDLKRRPCNPVDRDRGPFILQSDLKLYEWLQATMVSVGNQDTPAPADSNGPFKSNVLSHEVKFDIITTGTVTPGWKLTNATINQTGTFSTATRDRTQDLIITFGPPDPKWAEYVVDPVTKRRFVRQRELGPAATSAAIASDIGVAVSNAVRNGIRQ